MQSIKNFFQSFYSVKPYRKSIIGETSFIGMYFVQQLFIALVATAAVAFVIVQLRYYCFAPIIDNMPVIDIVDGKAHSKAKMPVTLIGGTCPILEDYFDAPKNVRFFNVHIDTTKSTKSFSDPKNKKKIHPEYDYYTLILAKDGYIPNSGGKFIPSSYYKKIHGGNLRIDKYMLTFITMKIFFVVLLIVPITVFIITLFVYPFVMIIFGWLPFLLSIISAIFVIYTVKRKATFSGVLNFALILFVPSIVIVCALFSFFHVPFILCYIIISVLIATRMILEEKKQQHLDKQQV